MDFSLIFNTRHRVSTLDNCLRSFHEKTKNLSTIELLVRVDDDDNETKSYFGCDGIHRGFPNLQVYFGPRPNSLNHSLNELALKAKGRYIFTLNDDVEMLTNNWNEKAIKNILSFKLEKNIEDDIIYGFTHDTSADKIAGAGYASFPIISRQAVQTIGFVMYPAFVGLGGDSSIYRVYKAINRVVDTQIGLDHVFHNTINKVVNPDKTAAEMRANTAKHNLDPFTFNIEDEVSKLTEFIHTYEPNYN